MLIGGGVDGQDHGAVQSGDGGVDGDLDVDEIDGVCGGQVEGGDG